MDYLYTKFYIRHQNNELDLVDFEETIDKGYEIYWSEIDKMYCCFYGYRYKYYSDYCNIAISKNKKELKKEMKKYLKN